MTFYNWSTCLFLWQNADQKLRGGKGFISVYASQVTPITEGSRGMNLEAGTGAGTTKEYSLLACPSCLVKPAFYSTHDHLPRDGTAQSELPYPSSIRKMPSTHACRRIWRGHSQLQFPLSRCHLLVSSWQKLIGRVTIFTRSSTTLIWKSKCPTTR